MCGFIDILHSTTVYSCLVIRFNIGRMNLKKTKDESFSDSKRLTEVIYINILIRLVC